MKRSILAVITVLLVAGGCNTKQRKTNMDIALVPLDSLKITVIYDNKTYHQGLRSDWGFACVIDVAGEKILFDTGARGDILLSNTDKLACHPRDIQKVFLSHEHWDHTGGLNDFLAFNPEVEVYLLKSFPGELEKMVKDAGADPVEIIGPRKIADGLYTTGAMGKRPDEQSMIITTDKGAIVITGCAHPGIVEIVKRARELTGQEILLVMGGFHLGGESEQAVQKMTDEFQNMGVRYVGPCHCTGSAQIEQFHQVYGDRWLNIGVGKVIAGTDLI